MEREAADWRARLPEGRVEHVVWPVRVAAFHDDGVPPSKWRGYDVLGLLCYYRHVYSRWSADFDEAPLELLQQEELEAWRTLLARGCGASSVCGAATRAARPPAASRSSTPVSSS